MLSRRDFLLAAPLVASLPAFARAAAGQRNPVGCQTNAWQIAPGDFRTLLARAGDLKRLGYEGFECNVRFVEGQFANAQAARKQIRDTGVRFYGPHVGLGFPADKLRTMVDGAVSLGAERFVVSGGGKSPVKDDRLDEEVARAKFEWITSLAKHCRKAGIRLVYHNHATEFASQGAEIEALLRQTDPELVWLLLDAGHAHRAKCDVPAFVVRHHRRIDAIHLRDLRDDRWLPLGQGEFDLTGLAAAIRKTAWPGWLIVEQESLKSADAATVESVLASDRRAIRKHFGV